MKIEAITITEKYAMMFVNRNWMYIPMETYFKLYKCRSADKMKQEIGTKLKNARIKAGLTQSQLAKELNVARPYISQIEAGKENLTIDTLLKIANALKRKLLIILG